MSNEHIPDAALPGDPWSHVRYRYGQLLGAEDFTAEQKAIILRNRLQLALLSGAGSVWGLRVDCENESDPPCTGLFVTPGLAVDVIGREIYVNERQCLDITGLHQTEDFWGTLEPLSAEDQDPEERRAYVVLRYEACLSEPVPAITPPCSEADEALAFSRVNDRFRIDLVAEPPPDPHPWQRDWMSTLHAGDTLRDRLLHYLLGSPEDTGDLSRYWQRLDTENFPLLLAEVHLKSSEGQLLVSGPVRNEVRALLPSVQLIAEQLLGQRLSGRDERVPFRVTGVEVARNEESAHQMSIEIQLTDAPAARTITKESLRVFTLGTRGWVESGVASRSPKDHSIVVTLKEDWTEKTTYQVYMNGAGIKPIATADGRPLAGRWDEPVLGEGLGKDVSIVATWMSEDSA